jgi:replicative DNA helicase
LAVEIWGNLSDVGVGGLYLILERTESSAFTKAVIQAAKLHHAAVVDPVGYAKSQNKDRLSKEELIAIRDAVAKLNDSNLHIRKPPSRGIHEIVAEIRRYVRLNGVKVVFVDQIGLIRGERFKGETAEMELRRTSNTLQELSDELSITIVVLCQENFDGETKNARAIEEDADWWLSIVQERNKQAADFGTHKHILIAKDSHNGNGGVRLPLILDKATLRFVYGVNS